MTASVPLVALARLVRYYCLISTTAAGSGHPTSSLSAADLMTALLFGGALQADLDHPEHPNNDRLIFSKGHAAPLLYALYAAAGRLSETELLTLRQLTSPLEGHPTLLFPYTEAATGSLGQGLSIGAGMAQSARLDRLPYRTYVLLGDSEMAEGSVWEAIQSAAYYQLDHLIGIIDVNRLGQRGQTMYGHDVGAFEQRVAAFGWETIVIDGHDLPAILAAYQRARVTKGKPTMIIAKTLKGKGIPLFEDQENWHGKALSPDELTLALAALGPVDRSLRGAVVPPANRRPATIPSRAPRPPAYPSDQPLATRKAYGQALVRLAETFPNLVVLDAEVSNSTFAETFKKAYPDRFFEMFIAEQHMVGAALGLARRGKLPFVSTFAAFLTRAFDQIRMSQYSQAHIVFVGSHAGVAIGEDGASQMGLEDLAMFRTIGGSTVLYPSDALSTDKLVAAAAAHHGIIYLRTTRQDTPPLYRAEDEFVIGGSRVLRASDRDQATIVAAGITLHEALAAYDQLQHDGLRVRVIDLYSVKPLDEATLRQAARDTPLILTVEDHVAEGGLGEAVASALANEPVQVVSLAVRRLPHSGKPAELLDFEGISRFAIARRVVDAIARQA